MKIFTNQYMLLFSLSGAVMYLIHPSWALPISITARGLLYFGLISYFSAFAYILNRWFNTLSMREPVIIYPEDFSKQVKDNVWLLIVCFIAVLLHISPISSPIYLIGDEALFLQNGLWIYDYFGPVWHKAAQYTFWIAIVLTITIYIKKVPIASNKGLSDHNAWRLSKSLYIFSGLCLLVIYFTLTRDLNFNLTIVREPPLHKFIYLISYFILGINYIGPRLWQLLFYILSTVYLYRTINLFSGKDTALLGASIYLFSPIIFDYAHYAELHSGVIFFIILISYYFMRFLLYRDNRGLLLTSYFIGTGFLYKRDIFVMFFVCCAYLVFHKIKDRELPLIKSLKILFMPLVTIIPWLIISKLYNWRNADMSLYKFTSLEKVTEWMWFIPASVSWGVFLLVVLSVFFVLIAKRNTVTLYFGLLFTAYYLFYTAQYRGSWIRMSMAFYPSIAIYLAVFLSTISSKIGWKHAFKLIYCGLTIYMIALCVIPPVSARLTSHSELKAQYFPNEKAMQWVRDNVKDGEKIVTFRFKPDLYYRDNYGIDNDKIIDFWYNFSESLMRSYDEISSPQDISPFCHENKISYILFPYGPKFIDSPNNTAIRHYLKENKNNEFIEAAKFNIDDNYIYILKLKDNSI